MRDQQSGGIGDWDVTNINNRIKLLFCPGCSAKHSRPTERRETSSLKKTTPTNSGAQNTREQRVKVQCQIWIVNSISISLGLKWQTFIIDRCACDKILIVDPLFLYSLSTTCSCCRNKVITSGVLHIASSSLGNRRPGCFAL